MLSASASQNKGGKRGVLPYGREFFYKKLHSGKLIADKALAIPRISSHIHLMPCDILPRVLLKIQCRSRHLLIKS